jgi:hypothetical protein
MKTTEERIQQLEQAHSRLNNQYINLKNDLEELISSSITADAVKNWISEAIPKEDVPALPDELVNGIDYKAVVAEVVKFKNVKWKDMDYTNWEIKLIGKEEYVYVAFIPTEITLVPGCNVKFTYAQPFQCRKLKLI